MGKYISSEVSKNALSFERGTQPASFTVTVHNDSYKAQDVNKFASFQLNLLAAGQDFTRTAEWYRLVPAVSYKIPPGDSTQFEVEILDIPPLDTGFIGTINLTAHVYSPELRDEDRKNIRLNVKGNSLSPPEIKVISPDLTVRPNSEVSIKIRLKNDNRKSIDCDVKLNGLPPGWLPEGQQKKLLLPPKKEETLSFLCRVPEPAVATSGKYPITFELLRPTAVPVAAQAMLQVLPDGKLQFSSDIAELWIPEKSKRWLNPRYCEATLPLSFNNQSNLRLDSSVIAQPPKARFRLLRFWPSLLRPLPAQPVSADPTVEISSEVSTEESSSESQTDNPTEISTCEITLQPEQLALSPGQQAPLNLHIKQRLPLFGWSRLRSLPLAPYLADPPAEAVVGTTAKKVAEAATEKTAEKTIGIENLSPSVLLRVAPVIPLWLQILLALIAGIALYEVVKSFGDYNHTAPINAVQINGQGNEVISASEDQSLRRWRIKGNRLALKHVVFEANASVRTAQYRPVGNDVIVAALENGVVQMTTASSSNTFTFSEDFADRALDIAFSRDARQLYSSHGSGTIRQWLVDPSDQWTDGANVQRTKPHREFSVGFAVYAIALLGKNGNLLAAGGIQNQLAIIDLQSGTGARLPYSSGGQTDQILDIATTAAHPNRLAIADNQGQVTIWNTENCVLTAQPTADTGCEPTESWSAHGGSAVRAIAFTQDGCYLASGGDDGQVMLWPLTGSTGQRQPSALTGHRIRQSSQDINAVDIIHNNNQLRIVSGGQERHIKLNTRRLLPRGEQSGGTCAPLINNRFIFF